MIEIQTRIVGCLSPNQVSIDVKGLGLRVKDAKSLLICVSLGY